MRLIASPFGLLAMVIPCMIGLALTWTLCRLPREIVEFAVAWLMVALPAAMLFGHCALSSER